MPVPPELAPFWSTFRAACPGVSDERFYEAFSFGDSAALADELGDLVRRGVKQATTGSLWSYEVEGKPLPPVGGFSIVLDGAGRPLCVIETLAVEVLPFEAVTAEFAAAEGEGDGSLAYWRQAHRSYFGRECARAGRKFSEAMTVVCERFVRVFPGGQVPG